MTDELLLERFVAGGDEAAFKALVVRHGPMVRDVCLRVLNDPDDADDAFQATFLVLVHRARSIRKRASLPYWLRGVARRVALKARARAQQRRACERQGVRMAAAEFDDEAARRELRALVLEELDRLPEKYRAPLVLCYLEGRSHEEAAQSLAWPLGTVKGRLSRARDLLRSRLDRRGVALTVGLLATLASDAEAATAPLVEATVRAAGRLRVGDAGAIEPGVAELAKSVAADLAAAETKVVAALLAIIALATATAGLASGCGPALGKRLPGAAAAAVAAGPGPANPQAGGDTPVPSACSTR